MKKFSKLTWPTATFSATKSLSTPWKSALREQKNVPHPPTVALEATLVVLYHCSSIPCSPACPAPALLTLRNTVHVCPSVPPSSLDLQVISNVLWDKALRMSVLCPTEQESNVPGAVQWWVQGAGPRTLLQLCAEPGSVHGCPGAWRDQQGGLAESWPTEGRWRPREGLCAEGRTAAQSE